MLNSFNTYVIYNSNIAFEEYKENLKLSRVLGWCDFAKLFSFIFIPAFPPWRAAGAAGLARPEIPHGFQQFQIFLLASPPRRDHE